ncbi:MAG: polyprenyl synthetase family protein [Bacteroidales bacterium]|nr:polyprenyl synthetase family protein [Bacteroidales bacterium]
MISDTGLDTSIRELFDNIEFTREPAGLYDPLRYMISIGGKRIRPRLCLISHSLFKDELGPGILGPAAGLEVFHTFTLIHDDIMDKSPLRRGCETVWKKWNEVTAILSGDVMLIDAYKRMAQAPENVRDKVLDLFSTTGAQVCDGQQYDMEFETRSKVTIEDYDMMIGLKTAVLIACSAKMGALIAGASDKACEALYRYGYELGMAFQVADDYLDAYGDEKVFGKPIGGDILNEKKSWLTVRALEKTSDPEAFLKAFEAPASTSEEKKEKIASVKAIYDRLGVADDARAEIVRFSESALDAVRCLGLPEEDYEGLKRFAEQLIGRAK